MWFSVMGVDNGSIFQTKLICNTLLVGLENSIEMSNNIKVQPLNKAGYVLLPPQSTRDQFYLALRAEAISKICSSFDFSSPLYLRRCGIFLVRNCATTSVM